MTEPRYVPYQGESWRLCDLARHLGVKATTLVGRLEKGLPLDQRQRPQRKEIMRGPGRGEATKHPLYCTWTTMRRRCQDPKFHKYAIYGGRGIRVCDRWDSDFWTFVADMGERPTGASLDRKDNDGPYSPENCRWATRSEQMRNRPMAKPFTWNGESMPVVAWAERLGLTYHEMWSRVRHYKGDMAKVMASVEKLKRSA